MHRRTPADGSGGHRGDEGQLQEGASRCEGINLLVADTVSAEAKSRKVKAGTMGLAQGHQPHVRDAAELLQKAWSRVTPQDIVRSGLNIFCCCVDASTRAVVLAQ